MERLSLVLPCLAEVGLKINPNNILQAISNSYYEYCAASLPKAQFQQPSAQKNLLVRTQLS